MPNDPLIPALGASNPSERRRAGKKIFEAGRSLAEPIADVWLRDPELGPLLSTPAVKVTVGVAVDPATFEEIRAAHGNPRLADVPPGEDAREFELQIDGEVRLDVLTTQSDGESGAIARFLKKFGEGIQQVEFEVTSLDRATELLRSRFRLNPLYPHARLGADGTRVNFFLAARPDGKKVLIELVEV
jgi:hypothetical protein